MTSPPPPEAESAPPPYISANQIVAEDEVVQPTILVISQHFIRAQSSVGAVLYELSQDITQSSDGESKASLSRVVRGVRMSASGAPRATQRSRHIYDLKRLPSLLANGFPYCLDATSRSAAAAGHLGLKTTSFPRTGAKILRMESDKAGGSFPKGYKARRETAKHNGSMFELRKAHDHYEWIDSEGHRIAVEDHTTDYFQLIVTTPLSRPVIDALVASWCLKIWHDRIELSIGKPQGCEFTYHLILLS